MIKVIHFGCDSKLGQEFHVQNNCSNVNNYGSFFFLFYYAHLDIEQQIGYSYLIESNFDTVRSQLKKDFGSFLNRDLSYFKHYKISNYLY